jgi:hypothetical protein
VLPCCRTQQYASVLSVLTILLVRLAISKVTYLKSSSKVVFDQSLIWADDYICQNKHFFLVIRLHTIYCCHHPLYLLANPNEWRSWRKSVGKINN